LKRVLLTNGGGERRRITAAIGRRKAKKGTLK